MFHFRRVLRFMFERELCVVAVAPRREAMRNENPSSEKESVVRASRFRFRVGRLPRLIIYRPLTVALATILVLPSICWLESRKGIQLGPSAAAFQATAQTA